MADISGTPGNDVIEGGEDNDAISGLDGDDVLIGNGGNDGLSGDNGADHLYGGAGEDTLDGGAGADVMEGGADSDTYIVDDINDVVIDSGPNSPWFYLDRIETTVDYTLSAGIEEGVSRNGADIVGNELDNILTAYDDAVLSGMGGNDHLWGYFTAATTLIGGTGDDLYTVDTDDTLVEFAGEGVDTISIGMLETYTIAANFENLDFGGDADIGHATLNGNELDNRFTFWIRDASIVYTIDGMGGNDVIVSDDLVALVAHGGAGNDVLLGGTNVHEFGEPVPQDILFGDAGNDRISSGGGNDSMTGGAGNDDFEVLVGGVGLPTITDFHADQDRLGFTELVTVPLRSTFNASMLHIGSGASAVAQTSAHRYIVNSATGAVYFDADGAGGVAQFQVASLNIVGGTLDASDFYVAPQPGFNIITGTNGADTIIGTDGIDEIDAGGGNDLVIAEGGRDQVFGGDGNDELRGSVGSDVLMGEAGNDLLNGSADHDYLYGGAGTDTLLGSGGDDVLDGGAGADRMEGGDNNDTYIVRDSNDTVIENGDARNDFDTVEAHINFTLGANIEALVLVGSARNGTGNGLHNDIEGNELDNNLKGLGGDDEMWGYGGNDSMDGGGGNDTLAGGLGLDTLNGGAGIDVLRGTSDWWDVPDDGVRDVLNGGDGNDELYAGANDHLAGGAGNDVYWEVTAGNTLSESAGGGIDTVQFSNASFTLGANFENVDFGVWEESLSGTLTLNGNSLANDIGVYNQLDDVQVRVFGLGGNDSIRTFGNVVADGGAGNDSFIADGPNNVLIGGSGNDSFEDYGGSNSFTGGTGADTFLLQLYYDGVNTVTDFNGSEDALRIRADAVDGTVGPVSAAAFHAGSAATTADQRFIYDAGAGALYYDSDGNGAAAQELLLNLTVASGTFNHQDIELVAG